MQLRHHQANPLRSTERARREGGYVMAMFGLLLVPLLLMTGFAVDIGSWYNHASDLQKAADAASLAGVVWLPDEAKARTVALDVAKRNGFDNADPNIVVSVTKSTKAPRRLKVTITDNRVGSFFYENLGGHKIDLSRTSFAEYVTPVPMGSPRNYFGLGTVLATNPVAGADAEYLYQSVNPYCTSKANGDRYQSGFDTGPTGSHKVGAACTTTPANPEYKASGYELYIDAVPGRPSPIEVRLYDARYNSAKLVTAVPGPLVCPTQPYIYPGDTTSGWAGPTAVTTNITITGPLQYQTRANSTTSTWSAVTVLGSGLQTSARADRLRYRSPAYTYPSQTTSGWTGPTGNSTNVTVNGPAQYQTRTSTSSSTWTPAVPSQVATGATPFVKAGNLLRYRSPTYTLAPCDVPTTVNEEEPSPDQNLNSNGSTEQYTYALYAADATPLDDTDNPLLCSQTYDSNATFEYQYLGSRRWNTLCSIPTTATSGKYILRVHNSGTNNPNADGSNQYGVVAKYTTTAGDGLCDGRTDVQCPRVYGKEAISVKAAATTSEASFYLAEIGPEHAGKKLKIDLFDPGEGGKSIEIMTPTGANSWAPVNFQWKVGTGTTSTTNSLDVSGTNANNTFNDKLVEITVDLTGYNPPVSNNWWQIRYKFTPGVEVTDRTTWSARIVGDPVHILEEN